MDFAVRFIAIAVVVYLVIVALMYVVQRQLQYFPDRFMYTPTAAGVPDMSIAELTSADGTKVVAWFKKAATAGAPTIV